MALTVQGFYCAYEDKVYLQPYLHNKGCDSKLVSVLYNPERKEIVTKSIDTNNSESPKRAHDSRDNKWKVAGSGITKISHLGVVHTLELPDNVYHYHLGDINAKLAGVTFVAHEDAEYARVKNPKLKNGSCLFVYACQCKEKLPVIPKMIFEDR